MSGQAGAVPGSAGVEEAAGSRPASAGPLRVAFVLSGLGRVQRGAEASFLEVARCLAGTPGVEVALFGSGREDVPEGVAVEAIGCRVRERFEGWPKLPTLRGDGAYEELSFAWNLARSGRYRPGDFDIAVHCTYPWVNWYLRWAGRRGESARTVYVTQNGDWPCHARGREFRHFACDGLVCTNPEHFERNRERHRAVLIPNGVDPERFRPRGPGDAGEADPLGVDAGRVIGGRRVVLMASALIPSKDVVGGIRAVARVPEAYLVVAGDGPERGAVAAAARELLPGRHQLLGSVPRPRMPALFRRADALLHMSRDEPFGLVYLEAASTGLPVVAHDGPGPRWILGEAGCFAATDDVERVAAALGEVLEPGRGAAMGVAARRRVLEQWTWGVQASRYLEFFRSLRASR